MRELFRWPPDPSLLLLVPALFLGFTVHELAHALVAYTLGDTSQLERKRLSLNPLRHVSWVGLVAFLLVGFGWAKPVMVDPGRFRIRNRALGMFLVSISGAAANLVLAVAAFAGVVGSALVVAPMTGRTFAEVVLFAFTAQPDLDAVGIALAVSGMMVTVNGLLAIFNLLPFPLFDGFHAVVSLIGAVTFAVKRGPDRRPGAQGRGASGLAGEEIPRRPAAIHFGIGLDYHRQGQWDEAIARYRQAIDHDADMAQAYYNQGLAYWAKGNVPLARSAFRAASQSGHDAGVRIQADLRLRDLTQGEQTGTLDTQPIPLPLELDQPAIAPHDPSEQLDPTVVRRVWLRLAAGAIAFLVLGVLSWAYSTLVLLNVFGG